MASVLGMGLALGGTPALAQAPADAPVSLKFVKEAGEVWAPAPGTSPATPTPVPTSKPVAVPGAPAARIAPAATHGAATSPPPRRFRWTPWDDDNSFIAPKATTATKPAAEPARFPWPWSTTETKPAPTPTRPAATVAAPRVLAAPATVAVPRPAPAVKQVAYPATPTPAPAAPALPAATAERAPALPAVGVEQTAMQPPALTDTGLPAQDAADYQMIVQLEPPGPMRVFRLDSESQFQERLRQEARERPVPERIEFPEEPTLSKYRYAGRHWPAMTEPVEPSYVCYRRLYFEELNSERYGWDLGIIGPFVSSAYFFKDVVLFPYHFGTDICRKHECSAGYCLPGNPVPYMLYPPQLSVTGLIAEATVVSALAAVFP